MSDWNKEHLSIEEQYKKRTGREYYLGRMTDVTDIIKSVHCPGGYTCMRKVFVSCDHNLLYLRFSVAPLRFNYVLVSTEDGKHYTDAPLNLFLLVLAAEHNKVKPIEMTKEPEHINENFLDPYIAYSILESIWCNLFINLDGKRLEVIVSDKTVRIDEGYHTICRYTLDMPTVEGVNLIAAILTQLVPYLPVDIYISKHRGQYRGAGYVEECLIAESIHRGSEYGSSVIWSDKHKFFIRITPKSLRTNIPGELSQEDKDLYMSITEQAYEEDKMSDVTDCFKDAKWVALCSNKFFTKGSDNILYFDFEYNYLIFRYVLVRKPDGNILTNAPMKTLQLLMPNVSDKAKKLELSTALNKADKQSLNPVLLTAVIGMHRIPFIVRLNGTVTEMSSEGNCVEVTPVGDDYLKHYESGSTHDKLARLVVSLDDSYEDVDQCYYGAVVRELASALPVTVKVAKCEKDYTSDKYVEKDYYPAAKIHFGVEGDKAVVWSVEHNMLVRMTPKKPTVKKRVTAKESAPVVALHEAIDLYCAQFKDGEFSKHIVEMLTALNVSETRVRKYLEEHTV